MFKQQLPGDGPVVPERSMDEIGTLAGARSSAAHQAHEWVVKPRSWATAACGVMFSRLCDRCDQSGSGLPGI